jgi:hypothetical protein
MTETLYEHEEKILTGAQHYFYWYSSTQLNCLNLIDSAVFVKSKRKLYHTNSNVRLKH